MAAVARFDVRQFLTFFGGSAAGLAIDLVGFQVLVLLGLAPWQANAISSTVSITAVYLVVTRYAFGVSTQLGTYVLFFAWYAGSVALFSTLIQVANSSFGGEPFGWKLLSVPVSFALNYTFSRFLFRTKPADPAGPAVGADTGPAA